MRFFSALFSLDKIPNTAFDLRRQARSLQLLVGALAITTFVATITQLILLVLSTLGEGEMSVPASSLPIPVFLTAELINILSTLTCWWLIRSNYLQIAVHFFFGSILLTVLVLLFVEPDIFPFMVILAFLPVVGATLLEGVRASLVYAVGAVFVPALFLAITGQAVIGHITTSTALILTVWLFGEGLSQALRQTNALTQQIQNSAHNLQQQVDSQTATLRHRTEQLALTVEIGQVASQATDSHKLLQSVVETIHKKAGYYHVAIFLWDAGSSTLKLSHSSTPLHQPFQFAQNEQNLISWVATQRQGRFLNDAPSHALHHSHPMLSQTRSELALPLQIRGKLIAVLDIHHQDFNFFHEEDLTIWQLTTNQISNYLEHTRLLAESQKQGDLLKQLPAISSLMFQQANISNALNLLAQQVIRLLQTDTASIWLWHEQNQKLQLLIRYINGQPLSDNSHPQLGQEFLKNQTLLLNRPHPELKIIIGSEFQVAVVIPLQQGNQPYGLIVFTRNHLNHPFPPEEVQFLEALALQAGTMIYNNELVEETRRFAQREQKVNQITESIRRNLDLKTILATTADELGSVLEGSLVQVRLYATKIQQENEDG